jgi:hypothetical protein
MASTVTPSTFQVKIKEDHVINGIRTVNENYLRIPNVTNYDRRIVTCPYTTSVDLINTNGLTPGPALFPSYSIAYGRITNMDDSNRLAVTFTSSLGTTGTLYPAKELFPASYTSGGEKGTAGTYTGVGTTTNGSGAGATLNVVMDTTAGHLLETSTLNITSAPTTTNNISVTDVKQSATSGTGANAEFTISATANTISSVTVTKAGENYRAGDTITFSRSALSSFGTVSGDLVVQLVPADLKVRPSSIIINAQGLGYAVGNTLTVAAATIGTPSSDLVVTLIASDFTTNTQRSYWTMECLPTSSIMFSSPNCSGSDFTGTFDQDIEYISVYAIPNSFGSGSIDVEYVLVNAPVATN